MAGHLPHGSGARQVRSHPLQRVNKESKSREFWRQSMIQRELLPQTLKALQRLIIHAKDLAYEPTDQNLGELLNDFELMPEVRRGRSRSYGRSHRHAPRDCPHPSRLPVHRRRIRSRGIAPLKSTKARSCRDLMTRSPFSLFLQVFPCAETRCPISARINRFF